MSRDLSPLVILLGDSATVAPLAHSGVTAVCRLRRADGIAQALAWAEEVEPDRSLVVVIGLRGKPTDVVRIADAARALPERVPILVVTATAGLVHLSSLLEIGVRGVVHADTDGERIGLAVGDLLDGGAALCPRFTAELLDDIDRRSSGTSSEELPSSTHPSANVRVLTRRENEIVRNLAGGEFSTAQLANRLGIEVESIRGHLKRIYVKVGVNSRAELVAWAFRNDVV